jgi:hypothetical protein
LFQLGKGLLSLLVGLMVQPVKGTLGTLKVDGHLGQADQLTLPLDFKLE